MAGKKLRHGRQAGDKPRFGRRLALQPDGGLSTACLSPVLGLQMEAQVPGSAEFLQHEGAFEAAADRFDRPGWPA